MKLDMKFDLKNASPQEKQKFMVIGLVVVILLVGGFFAVRTFMGGSGDQMAPPADANAGAPSAGAPPPGAPVPGVPGGVPVPGDAAPAAAAPAPGGQPAAAAPAPAAAAAPAPAAAPAAAPAPSAQSAPAPPAAKGAPAPTKSITVFGTVTVTYPAGWGIGMGSAGSAAVLTDGKGRFELRAPDPKAESAKAIVDSALKTMGKGAKAGQACKIANNDAYQCTVGSTKIIGVDAATRVLIVESVRGGSLAAYQPAFSKIEAGLQFR